MVQAATSGLRDSTDDRRLNRIPLAMTAADSAQGIAPITASASGTALLVVRSITNLAVFSWPAGHGPRRVLAGRDDSAYAARLIRIQTASPERVIQNRRIGKAKRNPSNSCTEAGWGSLRSTHPTRQPSHSRGARRPKGCDWRCPRKRRGRRESRVPSSTRDRAHKMHTGDRKVRRNTRPSLRNGFTAYSALSLETNSSCLHR